MKNLLIAFIVAQIFVVAVSAFGKDDLASSQSSEQLAQVKPTVTAAEAEIRQTIDSYIKAFNRRDAQAVASHWSETGEFVTPGGEKLVGRQQLQDSFSTYFKESPQAKIEQLDISIRFLSPGVAIERGKAKVIVSRQVTNETEYEAVHVKTANGWKMDSLRERQPTPPPPTHYDQLKKLEWMIGNWVDQDESSTIETNCRWTTNQNFIVRTFKIFIEDRMDFEGTQIIGWDPQASAIRSWMFDSDGGFGVGRWSDYENRWTVRTLNVLPDGRQATSTNIYELIDDNTLQFRSIGRQVDGELLPSIQPVIVSRVQE